MIPIGTALTLNFSTTNPATGVPQDADSTPTVDVYEDANDTPILSPTPVNRALGEYRVAVNVTTANGFDAGKSYNVVVTAMVASTAGKKVLATFLVAPGAQGAVSNIGDSTTAATLLSKSADTMAHVMVDTTAFTPTTTQFECDLVLTFTNHIKGRGVIWCSGSLARHAARIDAYSVVGGRGHITVAAMPAAPAHGDYFVLV